MAITASDILIKLSVTTGSAGNSTAQAAVDSSLGKYISTTQVTDNTLNNLFANATGAQNAASQVDYRCVFVHNAHATLTWQNAVVYMSSEVAGGAGCAIGVDATASLAIGSASVQAVTVASSTTAPAGVSFTSPTTAATGLSLGSIAPGFCKAYWVRRTLANTSAKDNDGVTIGYSGDTSE